MSWKSVSWRQGNSGKSMKVRKFASNSANVPGTSPDQTPPSNKNQPLGTMCLPPKSASFTPKWWSTYPRHSRGKRKITFKNVKLTLQTTIPIEKVHSETPPKNKGRKRETIPAPPPLRCSPGGQGRCFQGYFCIFMLKVENVPQGPDAEVGDRTPPRAKSMLTCKQKLPHVLICLITELLK